MRFLVVLVVVLGVWGCADSRPTDPGTHSRLSLSLDMSGAPDDVAEVRASLSRDGHPTQSLTLVIARNTAVGTFGDVAIGVRRLTVVALDADETVRYRGEAGQEPGLIGYWNFDTDDSGTVPDLSPNGNDAVLKNGAHLVSSGAS